MLRPAARLVPPAARLVPPAIWALALSGCADDPQPAPSPPPDVAVVENAALPPGTLLNWTIEATPALSIGVAEGEEAYQLFRVSDATVLDDGRIAIANAGTGQIRVFDASGVHAVSMGGVGGGPGEFRALQDVARWTGDSIIGWDRRQLRVSVFDGAGEHGRTFRVREFDDTFGPEFRGLTSNRQLLIRSGFPRRDDAPFRGMFRPGQLYALVDADGRLTARLGVHPGEEGFLVAAGGMESFSEHPHGKRTVSTIWQDHFLVGTNDRYELQLFNLSGQPTKVIRLVHEVRPPTQDDMDAWFEEFTANDTPEERADFRRVFNELPVLDAFPAFVDVVVDRLDHLWVQDFNPTGDGSITWVVFEPSGEALGRIETPPGLEVYEIGEGYLLGRSRDELGVDYVQLWPLTR